MSIKHHTRTTLRVPTKQNAPKGLGEAPDIVLPPFTPGIWDEDRDMVNLRKHITEQIRDIWNNGIESFIEGDWADARDNFQEVLDKTKGNDGPSKLLLQEINKHNCISPPNWQGYRSLY